MMELTMQITKALGTGEYTEPSKIKEFLKSGSFASVEFKDELWQAILSAYPCPKEKDMPNSLTESKKALWKQFFCDNPNSTNRDFINHSCSVSTLCKQCFCKKQLIDFFEKAEGSSADTVRHRITTWLSGKVQKLERITYIQLCFALELRIFPEGKQLTYEEKQKDANRFLTISCRQPPLYAVRPDEAVYYFCLANSGGRSNIENWNHACELIEKVMNTKPLETAERDVYTMYAASELERISSEEELLRFVKENRLDEHEMNYTAKENCRFLFEQLVDWTQEDDKKNVGTVKKGIAIRVLDAIKHFDECGEIDSQMLYWLGEYSLGEILRSSGVLDDIINGNTLPDRTTLLLTILALNCSKEYHPENNTLDESEEFTDMPTFEEYLKVISTALRAMGMAPVYPRWRIDYIVLCSYFLMKKDILKKGIPDALSEYILRTLRTVSGEM